MYIICYEIYNFIIDDFENFSITEENFWRNYFYRVSLICQASEASDANNESQPGSRLASVDEPQGNE